jgi:hypothetical protein
MQRRGFFARLIGLAAAPAVANALPVKSQIRIDWIPAGKIANGTVTEFHIADGMITSAKLAPGSLAHLKK